MKKNTVVLMVTISMLLTACGNESEMVTEKVDKTADVVTSVTEESSEIYNSNIENEQEELQIWKVIDRVFTEVGLENAIDIHSETYNDDLRDNLFLLCSSEGGKYKAYGVVSPEYKCCGIIIDDVIDREDNLNYFYDTWTPNRKLPYMKIVDCNEYVCEFGFTQTIDGVEIEQTVILDSFDTGTVTPRENTMEDYLIAN